MPGGKWCLCYPCSVVCRSSLHALFSFFVLSFSSLFLNASQTLGSLYAKVGKTAEAERMLQRAVTVVPTDADAWMELGALLEAHDVKNALKGKTHSPV